MCNRGRVHDTQANDRVHVCVYTCTCIMHKRVNANRCSMNASTFYVVKWDLESAMNFDIKANQHVFTMLLIKQK